MGLVNDHTAWFLDTFPHFFKLLFGQDGGMRGGFLPRLLVLLQAQHVRIAVPHRVVGPERGGQCLPGAHGPTP